MSLISLLLTSYSYYCYPQRVQQVLYFADLCFATEIPKWKFNPRSKWLEGAGNRKGVCTKAASCICLNSIPLSVRRDILWRQVFITSPKKPNSGQKKAGKRHKALLTIIAIDCADEGHVLLCLCLCRCRCCCYGGGSCCFILAHVFLVAVETTPCWYHFFPAVAANAAYEDDRDDNDNSDGADYNDNHD